MELEEGSGTLAGSTTAAGAAAAGAAGPKLWEALLLAFPLFRAGSTDCPRGGGGGGGDGVSPLGLIAHGARPDSPLSANLFIATHAAPAAGFTTLIAVVAAVLAILPSPEINPIAKWNTSFMMLSGMGSPFFLNNFSRVP